jgi:hypothetical protein
LPPQRGRTMLAPQPCERCPADDNARSLIGAADPHLDLIS